MGKWNIGECTRVPEPERLCRWLPEDGADFDLIAVGLQENKISNDLLHAIHILLGECSLKNSEEHI